MKEISAELEKVSRYLESISDNIEEKSSNRAVEIFDALVRELGNLEKKSSDYKKDYKNLSKDMNSNFSRKELESIERSAIMRGRGMGAIVSNIVDIIKEFKKL